MEYEYIGKHIKKLRKERGYSQKDLAHLINRSVSSVAKYESNQVELPISVLDDIAKVLDVPIDVFFLDNNIDLFEEKTEDEKAYLKLVEELNQILFGFAQQSNHYDRMSQVGFQFYLKSIIEELCEIMKYYEKILTGITGKDYIIYSDTENILRNIERLAKSFETTASKGTIEL